MAESIGSTCDVAIVGGGVIGLSLAWALAGQGASVALLEQGEFGRESSWAGAGMLPPGRLDRAATPEAKLRALSAGLWDGWVAALQSETGIDPGYLRCGAIHLGESAAALNPEIDAWMREGVDVRPLSGAALLEIEPALSPDITVGYHLPAEAQVRNPRLIRALVAGCVRRGVRMLPATPVFGFATRQTAEGTQVTALRTAAGDLSAGRYCVAGGAWSRQLLGGLGLDVAVEPVRGQIVLLSSVPSPLRGIVEFGPRYLVPRGDGRVLVGSTEERVGFDRGNTAEGVSGLLEFAMRLAPALGRAAVERTWAGLRPGSIDGLPYLGRAPGYDNLLLAAGHYRNGLQMSPGTALVLRQLILGEQPTIPLEPYRVDRAG